MHVRYHKWASPEAVVRIARRCGIPERYIDVLPANPYSYSELRKGTGMYVSGPVGVGKTELICRFAKHALLTKTSFRFVSVPSLLNEIRNTFGNSEISDTQIIEKYASCTVLFLDDLGVEKTTEWVLQTLYLLIDTRYRDMKPLYVTSNFSLDEIAQKLHDRIASRISEMCKEIELTGKDRRSL